MWRNCLLPPNPSGCVSFCIIEGQQTRLTLPDAALNHQQLIFTFNVTVAARKRFTNSGFETINAKPDASSSNLIVLIFVFSKFLQHAYIVPYMPPSGRIKEDIIR